MPLTEQNASRLRKLLKARTKVSPSGCWLWTGVTILSAYKNKYGVLWVALVPGGTKKQRGARRLAYLAYRVQPSIGDRAIDVTCGNSLCINPEHLVPSCRRKSHGPSDTVNANRKAANAHLFDTSN